MLSSSHCLTLAMVLSVCLSQSTVSFMNDHVAKPIWGGGVHTQMHMQKKLYNTHILYYLALEKLKDKFF